MSLSVFDIFKVGIGPVQFAHHGTDERGARFCRTAGGARSVEAHLPGLGATVRLVGAHRPRPLHRPRDFIGSRGHEPGYDRCRGGEFALQRIRTAKRLRLLGIQEIDFDEPLNLLFHTDQVLPGHSNGMCFTAHDAALKSWRARSITASAADFVVRAGAESNAGAVRAEPPYRFDSGDQLLEHGKAQGLEIHEIMLARERTLAQRAGSAAGLMRIWQVMQDCVRRGFDAQGLLPGVLRVRRRAPKLVSPADERRPVEPHARARLGQCLCPRRQ